MKVFYLSFFDQKSPIEKRSQWDRKTISMGQKNQPNATFLKSGKIQKMKPAKSGKK